MNTAKPSLRTADLALAGFFTALLAVCSWISIPAAVPFTLQTFGVFLTLELLGGRRGLLAILAWLLLGAAGLPVFAGFRGGVSSLLGTTGGYLIGFVFTGLIYMLAERLTGAQSGADPRGRVRMSLPVRIAVLVLGLAVCYAFGTLWFILVYTRTKGAVGWGTALGWCVIPFVIPDLLKLALAEITAARLKKHLPLD